MKIVICSSMKYRDLIKKTFLGLAALNIEPVFPNLDNSTASREAVSVAQEKKILALDHYKAIDTADAVYFITPSGYMGTSAKLELGYALAKK